MILHMVLLVLGVLGANSYPQRRQLILVPAHEIFQQRAQEPIIPQDYMYIYPNHLQQKQGYVPHNGFVYAQDGAPEVPQQPGYMEALYAFISGNSVTQPPPVTTVAPTEAASEDPKPTSESETSTDNEATTPESELKEDLKPIKIQQDDSKLEQLEPDAEVIPDTLKTTTNPQVPLVPYPANPGFIPGQRFYILNNPQFGQNHPGLIYPNTQIRPQPTLRYPGINGYQQRFLILGQPNIEQPNYPQPQNNQQVIFLDGNSNEQLRGRQSQRLQIPPLGYTMFGRQIQPNFNIYSATSEESQEQEGQITENFNNYAPLIQAHYGFSQPNVEDNSAKQPAGKSSLQFTRVLEESSDDTTSSFSVKYNSKSGIQNNDDSVVIEAEPDSKKNEKKSKVELTHKDLDTDPGLARADPHAIALSGKGGTAQSIPKGTAIVGPSGIAISDPIATALAGPLAKIPSIKEN